mmetsp:Transcript_147308/g.455698  ORF Transcript_147308/g.455698 Transcript_147308/m.455698 type:complete len:363 (+) Transcript_147308:159-1247(+)
MAPGGVQRLEAAAWKQLRLRADLRHGEVLVGGARHEVHARLDPAQGLGERGARRQAVGLRDVRRAPRVELRQQVQGIRAGEAALVGAHDEVLAAREGHAVARAMAPQLLPVELHRHPPAGVDPAEGPQGCLAAARQGRATLLVHLDVRIRQQRGLEAVEEHGVVVTAACGAADRGYPRDPLGEHDAPVQCLHGPHRVTVDEREPRDAEAVEQQRLQTHVVAHARPARREALVSSARGGREGDAVAEQVDDDDKIPVRVQHLPRAHVVLELPMHRVEGGRVQNHVRLVRVQRAVRLVGQEAGLQGLSSLQPEVRGHVEDAPLALGLAGTRRRCGPSARKLLRERPSRLLALALETIEAKPGRA